MRNKIKALLIIFLITLTVHGQTYLGIAPWGSGATAKVLPPTNQWMRNFGNPILNNVGNSNVYSETTLYYAPSNLYLIVVEQYAGTNIFLMTNGTDPLNPNKWGLYSVAIGTNGGNGCSMAFSPSDNKYYLYIGGGLHTIYVMSNSTPWGVFSNATSMLAGGNTNNWDYDCSEPDVIYDAKAGLWRMIYTGKNVGLTNEQSGLAYGTVPWGITNRYAGNPWITNGLSTSYNGQVADSWIIPFGGGGCVGYSTIYGATFGPGAQIASGFTTNWSNFINFGVTLPTNNWGWFANYNWRGKPAQFGRNWILPYSSFSNIAQIFIGLAYQPADNAAPTFTGTESAVASDLSAQILFTNDIPSCAGCAIGTSAGVYTATNAEDVPTNFAHSVHFYGLTASTTYFVLPLASNMTSFQASAGRPFSFTTASGNTDTTVQARYLVNEGGGTAVNDTSGNSQNGTTHNTPTWIAGNGLTFASASSQYVLFTTNINVGLSNWTFSAWFKTTSTGNAFASVFGKTYFGSITGRWGLYQNNPNLEAHYQDNEGTITVDATQSGYLDGNWHNATVTIGRDNGTTGAGGVTYSGSGPIYEKLYVDGVLKASTGPNISSGSPPAIMNINQPVQMGVYGSTSGGQQASTYFNGSVSMVEVWNRTLPSNEVIAFYNGGRQ